MATHKNGRLKNWKDEKPKPYKLIFIIDANGVYDGHHGRNGTPIIYDGENVETSLAHTIRADVNNIVQWGYYEDLLM